ncbi:MAG: SUMF1/EgtB/PvdO family nonheme iron enzyme [Desulfocapsaceae bacterium]|nr:SUMF1/EgtB/PvdO family nonheme iron enzyme [Desulfocapsaceae bacterium]
MSYYVFGSHLSYPDYLQEKSFSDDIENVTRQAGRETANRISMEVSRQTREVIASNEALANEHIQALDASTDRITGALDASTDRITGVLNEGFEQLSYGLDNISAGISELNATFHWGFGEVIASLGHMNDTLDELVKIAKTPVQTVAFNHFEIARDAFRQGLYQECVEELGKAIAGDHTSAGYKLEWRFHQMMGTVRLGFTNGDMMLVNLAKAEESFLLAARYGKADYPEDAGRAFLSAGWAAYCQGKMPEALAHTEQAMALHPRLGEAFFQAAKVRMALGQVDSALPVLGKAIDLDRFYALKAAGDGDFQQHDERLREFIDALRLEKYHQTVPHVKVALDKIQFWRKHSPEVKKHAEVGRLEELVDKGGAWPLLDILAAIQSLDEIITKIEVEAKDAKICLTSRTPKIVREVVVKPGGFFRKAVTEMRTLEGVQLDVHNGLGTRIASLEFCPIPAGTFMMGDDKKRKVSIDHDFLLGKYSVTRVLWHAVMDTTNMGYSEDHLPVEDISLEKCNEFIKRLNILAGGECYRMPTEAEWEYACRAGSNVAFCYGSYAGRLSEYAWYESNSGDQFHKVGLKKPNAWGLHDMHGNVWEFCQDTYYDGHGGSFKTPAIYCRSGYRAVGSPISSKHGLTYFGFRLLREIH